MAASPINPLSIFHARSISLPPRTSTVVPEIDEVLFRIKSSQAASCSSSSVIGNLNSFRDLYNSIDRVLLLPSTQQIIAQDSNKKQVDKVIDALLSILDICGTAKDALAQAKEHVQQLLSALRRKRSHEYEIGEYLASRKAAKKAIRKCLYDLKSKRLITSLEKDYDANDLASQLSQILGVMSNVFESMLCFISGLSKPRGWSLAAKLIRLKTAINSENEFNRVDATLSRISQKTTKSCDLQNNLESLDSCIQDLQDELDCHFRLLIKIRVSLLNILSY